MAVAGHHHHPHLAHIGGQFDVVVGGLALGQLERPAETDHRREAAALLLAAIAQRVGTAQRQHLIQFAAVGAHHLIEQVPGQHAQGLALVKRLVRARRGETGDAQQPLVDHRQGVGHGPSAALGDRHRQGAFRAYLTFRADVRHQAGGRVVHQQRRDAVEADRPVVVASGVGLQQRHVDIHIGRHGGGNRHFQSQGVALLAGFQPVVVEHPGAVFQAHQQAALAAHRHLHAGGVAHLIVVPVGAQRQPGGGVALGAAFATPAQVDGAADAVAAVALADPQQVPAPLVIGAGQGPLGAPVGVGGEGVLAQFFGVRVADEVGQVVVAAVPPPAPVDAVEAQGQVAAGLGLAVLVQRQEADLVVPVAAQGAAPAVAFRHAHAHPVPVGAHRYAAHLGAVVAAVFEHPGGERGGGHARRGQLRQIEREARVALVVELAFKGRERLGA